MTTCPRCRRGCPASRSARSSCSGCTSSSTSFQLLGLRRRGRAGRPPPDRGGRGGGRRAGAMGSENAASLVAQPARSHLSLRRCRRCVMKMDHHRPWVNNCVGFYNYKCFVLFLVYMHAGCAYTAMSCGVFVWEGRGHGGVPVQKHGFLDPLRLRAHAVGALRAHALPRVARLPRRHQPDDDRVLLEPLRRVGRARARRGVAQPVQPRHARQLRAGLRHVAPPSRGCCRA